ncbi:MAG: hypothetical protein HPY65_13205 [Syntrophaceae bacterium]|nr:hypothetical protein [Syntrophaceae bacterium]
MTRAKSYEDLSCRYFRHPGRRNTKALLEAAAGRAEEAGIRKVLVATCSGRTAFEARKIFAADIRIIAVTHFTGFEKPNHQELAEADRRKLESLGVSVLTAQHAFGGVGRGIRKRLGTYQVDEIMAFTLRLFGQGTKVAVELALMAADAGLARTDEDVVSIGGTEEGCDAALIIRPANSSNVFDLKVKEIIAKPASF